MKAQLVFDRRAIASFRCWFTATASGKIRCYRDDVYPPTIANEWIATPLDFERIPHPPKRSGLLGMNRAALVDV